MKPPARFVALLALLLAACTVRASELPEFRFRHLTTHEGLAANTVRAVLQDSSGYLWFGTDEGLDRYDGIRIRHFPLSNRRFDECITALQETDSLLWIGTVHGVYCFDYATEQIRPFDLATPEGETVDCTVRAFTTDLDGCLWIATEGQGVFCYSPAGNGLYRRSLPAETQNVAADLLADADNRLWAVTNQGPHGLYRLNRATNRFEPFALHYDHAPKEEARPQSLTLLQAADGRLWLGTWQSGLHCVDTDTGHATVHLPPSQARGTLHIHSLLEYAPGLLLAGSDDGLLLFDVHTGQHRLLSNPPLDPAALSSRFVYPLTRDREGGLWAGTFYGGVCYSPPGSAAFENYGRSTTSGSLPGSVIARFCEDRYGRIWIASDDGGLCHFLPAEGRFVSHPLPGGGRNVHALCLDGDDLWVGTYADGIHVMDTRTGRFRPGFSNGNLPPEASSSYAIFRDRTGTVWVSTLSGIYRYDRSSGRFLPTGELHATAIDIDQDSVGNLWFATQGNGIFRLDTAGRYRHYPTPLADSPASSQANCIHVDPDGTLWAGTQAGLCRLDTASDSFTAVSLPADGGNDNICGIVRTGATLWLTTSHGLLRYNPTDGSCLRFTRDDGLHNDCFVVNAVMQASDGKVYAGTANGFNAFLPHRLPANRVPPPVVVNGIEVDGSEVRPGEELLPRWPEGGGPLHLYPEHRVVSLRFAALSFCVPSKNRYVYLLEGFDKGWTTAGSEHRATYTNLPPGHYVFRVRATNNSGLWSTGEAKLLIEVHPPFYQTVPARILQILLVLLAAAFCVRLAWKRANRRQAAALARTQAEQQQALHEAKINFFTTIAHEIRTPVTLIIAPLDKVMRSSVPLPPAVMDDLTVIERNSRRLLDLVSQLLDFRKVEREGLPMHPTRLDVRALADEVARRFEPSFRSRNLRLTTSLPDRPLEAVADGEQLTKLISNLLSNALKYAHTEAVLSCSLSPDGMHYVLSVADDGPGIPPEQRRLVFRPFFQGHPGTGGTGIGLSIVAHVAERHGGEVEVLPSPSGGTLLTATLPVSGPPLTPTLAASAPTPPPDILPDLSVPASQGTSPTVVLVVEDHADMRSFLADSLSTHYQVLTASDGSEALEVLRAHEVTLVVSDWMMPRTDGPSLCRTLRADPSLCHVPFVLLTAKTDDDSRVEGMDCGADAYVEKPFSVAYLLACLRNLLQLRQLLRRRFSSQPSMPLDGIAFNPTDAALLQRMEQLVEEHLADPHLSADFLARELGVSRSGLFAKVKSLAGATPGELIQLIRLKRAAQLLAEGGRRINEVCYMVGFSSPSYFAKCFQRQFGVKPTDYATGKRTADEKEKADTAAHTSGTATAGDGSGSE